MSKKIEGYSAEISVDNRASKQLEKIIKDNQSLSKEMNALQKNMERASKQSEKYTKDNQKLNNEIVRMRNNMDRLNAKKTRVKVDGREVTKTQKELNKFEKALNHLKKPVHVSIKVAKGINSQLKSVISQLTSIQTLAAGVAIGYGVSTIYEKTVGKAMSVQLESTVLRSMAKTRGLNGPEIEKQLRARALKSILSEEEFIGAGRAFIPYSGNTKQVMQLTSLAERLGLYDPEQGLAGAKFAMKELLSGESKSLRTRFELPAKSIKDLEKFVDKVDMQKPQNIDKFIKLLDKTLSSSGIGSNFIQQIEETPFAQSQMFQEYMVKGLSMMGNKVLPDVNKKLVEFNKRLDSGGLTRFVKVGSKGLKFLTDSILLFVDVIDSRGPQIERWFDNTFNFLNSTLQQIKSGEKSLGDAVNEALNKIILSVNEWIKNNKEAISSVTGSIVNVMAMGISSNTKPLVDAGFTLAGAVIQGFVDGLSESTLGKMVLAGSGGLKDGAKYGPFIAGLNAMKGWGTVLYESSTKGNTTKSGGSSKKQVVKTPITYHPDPLKKKAIGGKIPYDNFPALLHEGEEVLTKQEAKGTKRDIPVILKDNTFVVREEADIYKIVAELVRMLKKERVAYGGEW